MKKGSIQQKVITIISIYVLISGHLIYENIDISEENEWQKCNHNKRLQRHYFADKGPSS